MDTSARVATEPAVATRFYYGWVVLGVSTLAMVGTLPGRSQGLGLITEPLLTDLGISRLAFAQLNLVATLIGALFCVGIGGLVDRRGSRVVLTAVAAALGTAVLLMSRARGAAELGLLLTLTRGLGQSALSIVSLAMIGKWFRRRLTAAMAAYAVAMSVGFMATFPAVGALVQAYGWRSAWATIGMCLVLGLAPIAWLLDRSAPETIGLDVDGDVSSVSESDRDQVEPSATFRDALASPAFWVVAAASSVYGLVASLVLMAIALLGLIYVRTIVDVMLQAVVMGLAGGFVMVVFFGFWGRAYGRTHLGRIQAGAQAMTVLASAMGPLVLAACVERTGSYAVAFAALAVVVLVLAVAAALVPMPRGADAPVAIEA